MEQNLRSCFAKITERKTWECRAPVQSAVLMGVIYYLLIVGMIVFGSAVQYRFIYGNF